MIRKGFQAYYTDIVRVFSHQDMSAKILERLVLARFYEYTAIVLDTRGYTSNEWLNIDPNEVCLFLDSIGCTVYYDKEVYDAT